MATSSTFVSGSNTLARSLPAHPGYAMGGIVPRAELDLPYLHQQMGNLEIERAKVESEKVQLKALNASPEASPSVGRSLDPQKAMSGYVARLEEIAIQLAQVTEKIKAAKHEQRTTPLIKAALPINHRATRVTYKPLSNDSENMHYVIISGSSGRPEALLNAFSDHLARGDSLKMVADLVKQVSGTILSMVKQDQEVCVIGSFVTLSKVKVLDPIVIRANAILDKTMLANVEKYAVISETVLGGAFIGFGTVTKSVERTAEATVQTVASSINVFSFVAQGAIPKTRGVNLWQTYEAWKETLLSQEHSGYPIAFKTRELEDVLTENERFEYEDYRQIADGELD
jgi:hypothetical protein